MNITVTGGSGFIGKALIERLQARGDAVTVLGRKAAPGVAFFRWDASSEPAEESLASADAVIHLAGEPVAQRWTPEVKQRISASRLDGTRHLVHALSTQPRRPRVLVSGSAIGIYGDRGDEVLTEVSAPGKGFLADLSVAWEEEAELAGSLGMRVVRLRTGIVLGKGGALEQMLTPFRAGVGGKLGTGRQWISWIHIDDIVGLILHAVEREEVRGAMNGTAPDPVRNSEFTETLARTIHRPAMVPVPAFGLRLLYGEMAQVLLASQRVLPQVAQSSGYRFRFPVVDGALSNLLG